MATQRVSYRWFMVIWPLCFVLSCVNHEIIRVPDCVHDPVFIQLDGPVQHTTCDTHGGFAVRVDAGDRDYSLYLNGTLQALEFDPVNPLIAFEQLSSGDYIVEVIDVRGCSDTLRVSIVDLRSNLAVSVLPRPDDSCHGSNGSATVGITGARGFFDIFLDGELLFRQESALNVEINDLEAGVHNIEIIDSTLCSHQAAVNIPRAPTGISWSRDVRPIIQTYCAKAGCHVPETGRVDFTSFNNIVFYSTQIRTRVHTRSMPYDGPLPPAYISMIICWIDDGAPAN